MDVLVFMNDLFLVREMMGLRLMIVILYFLKREECLVIFKSRGNEYINGFFFI